MSCSVNGHIPKVNWKESKGQSSNHLCEQSTKLEDLVYVSQ